MLSISFRLILRRYQHRARIAALYYLRRQHYQPFFILGEARTGTNLLADYLRSVPGVSVAGEILNPHNVDGIRQRCISRNAVIRHIAYSLNSLFGSSRGAQIHIGHLDMHGMTADDLHLAFPEAKFLIIYRSDIGAQYVSWRLARVTGRWVGRSERDKHRTTIRVDADDLRAYCQRIRARYESVVTAPWVSQSACILRYEDLASDAQRVFNSRVFPLLGLEPCEIRTSMVKQNTQPLEKVVENFDSVCEVFRSATHCYQ